MAVRMIERRRTADDIAAHAKLKKPKVPKAPKHLLAVEKGSLDNAIALLMWNQRHRNPEMAVTITEHDIKGMEDSNKYTKQKPKIFVRALSTGVVIGICDQDGNAVVIEENNETDLARKEAARDLQRAKDQMGVLVNDVLGQMAQGTFSDDSIRRLCNGAMTLARS